MYTLKHVLRNKKYFFKIKILTCLLLCRSFGNIILINMKNTNMLPQKGVDGEK